MCCKLPRQIVNSTIIDNPAHDVLRGYARHDEKRTVYGSASFITQVRNRSAKFTYIVEDGVELGVRQNGIALEEAQSVAEKVMLSLQNREIIRLDRQLGITLPWSFHCRLYIPREYARIPFMWHNTLFPTVDKDADPDFVSIYVPDWPEKMIFVHPEEGITYILGTDYFGECKKSFLRMGMYRAKKMGGLGLHSGSKVIRIVDKLGEVRNIGFLMFGLSGTGKTTLTIHDHHLTGAEGVVIRQDDVVILDNKGASFGTENGFFIKTEGLDDSQKVLFNAAIKESAIFENVMVHTNGDIDFKNNELTSNGRGIVLRSDVEPNDSSIDLDIADKIIFITRRKDIVPIAAKLNAVQAAAFFMLGESIETSAGDPSKAGLSKREVGTNPFIIGPEAEEGNRFYEILQNNPHIECFLINTGSVGMKGDFPGEKITIEITTNLMKLIAKDQIGWRYDKDWGYQVINEASGIDIDKYNPANYYSKEEYSERVVVLKEERVAWLNQFPGLNKDICSAIS